MQQLFSAIEQRRFMESTDKLKRVYMSKHSKPAAIPIAIRSPQCSKSPSIQPKPQLQKTKKPLNQDLMKNSDINMVILSAEFDPYQTAEAFASVKLLDQE